MTSARLRRTAVALAVCTVSLPAASWAAELPEKPGAGVEVQPVKTSIAEENFQYAVVQKGLEALGYEVEEPQEVTPQAMFLALKTGDVDFAANYWDPLSRSLFDKAGGRKTLAMRGAFIPNNVQGYLIDKKTAEEHGVHSLKQLQDPKIAALFDADGDGKADLTGCNAGWTCETVIEHHLDAYDLRDTVQHNQGSYFALMADTITRFQQGKPILYYTWTPLWVSGALEPGTDVEWMGVPFTSLPDEPDTVKTTLPDGTNLGWSLNTQRIVANKEWAEKNPAAAEFFARATIPVDDVSAQNAKMRGGEDDPEDIERHADEWIAAHREQFDAWLTAARKAAAEAEQAKK